MSHCDRPQDGCTCRLIPTICLSSITIRWARLFRYAYVRARCPMSNPLHVHVETVAHHVYLVSSSGPPSPPDGARQIVIPRVLLRCYHHGPHVTSNRVQCTIIPLFSLYHTVARVTSNRGPCESENSGMIVHSKSVAAEINCCL